MARPTHTRKPIHTQRDTDTCALQIVFFFLLRQPKQRSSPTSQIHQQRPQHAFNKRIHVKKGNPCWCP